MEEPEYDPAEATSEKKADEGLMQQTGNMDRNTTEPEDRHIYTTPEGHTYATLAEMIMTELGRDWSDDEDYAEDPEEETKQVFPPYCGICGIQHYNYWLPNADRPQSSDDYLHFLIDSFRHSQNSFGSFSSGSSLGHPFSLDQAATSFQESANLAVPSSDDNVPLPLRTASTYIRRDQSQRQSSQEYDTPVDASDTPEHAEGSHE
jgi:hypothetical protein